MMNSREDATVTTFTVDSLVAELERCTERLVTRCGAETLAEAVHEGLRWELPVRAVGFFDELFNLAFLAGLDGPDRSDPDDVDVWVARIEQIVATGQLPD